MAVFDFNEGLRLSVDWFGTGPTLTRTEDGGTVNFTLSIDQIDGASGPAATGRAKVIAGGSITSTNALYFSQHTVGGDLFRLTATSATGANDTFLASVASPLAVTAANVVGTWTVRFTGGGAGTVTTFLTPGNLTASVTSGSFTGITFTSSQANAVLNIDTINAQLNCFCAGTAISVPGGGAVAVETLRPGDRVLKADGRPTTVRWLGRQPVDTRLTHPAMVNPIRIAAGALAEGVPARDLLVSADHAIAVDGHLVNAGALVNGSSIHQVRDMPLDGFTYYHVETDAHELILAENTPAESFIDYAGRDGFENRQDRADATTIEEMDLPRISAARLVPGSIRDRIAARAGLRRAA